MRASGLHRSTFVPLVLVSACWWTATVCPAQMADRFVDDDAVLINVTERDLNRIVRGSFRSRGAASVEGVRRHAGDGVSNLSYRARLSEPVVKLGEDGRMRIDLAVEEAALDIGRVERRILRRRASCEHLGAHLDPSESLEVSLELALHVEDGDLRVSPEYLTMTDPRRDLRLSKPERCENMPLPKWLVWQLGKPALRRKLDRLDDLLLEKLQDDARDLGRDEGLLRKQWRLTSALDGKRSTELVLYPRAVDTSGGSLLLVLGSAADVVGPAADRAVPAWTGPWSDRTFVALSKGFVNGLLDFLFSGVEKNPLASGEHVRRLLGRSALSVLVPGLGDEPRPDDLSFSLHFGPPPRIDFRALRSSLGERRRASIHFGLDDLALHVGRADGARLGTLRIVRARVGVVPYLNRLGGISFEILENEWEVRGHGLEFDEALVAGMLQEIVFGEAFETTFRPIARELFEVDEIDLAPGYFRLADPYLVVGLADVDD